MRKLPECDHCLLCAHDYHLICAVHPAGPEGNICLDFRPDPDLDRRFKDFLGLQWQSEVEENLGSNEEQWQSEGARFVEGELVIQHEPSC